MKQAIQSAGAPLALKLLSAIARIGARPDEDEERQLRRTIFVAAVLFGAIPSAGLVGLIVAPYSGLVSLPLFFFVGASLTIVLLLTLLPRHYELLLWTELLLVLLMPFAVAMAMGAARMTAMLWALMCPLGAMVMAGLHQARRWFYAYLALFGLWVLAYPYLSPTIVLPAEIQRTLVAMDIGGTSVITFLLFHYFVRQREIYQQRSDTLLLNILPAPVASILRHENRLIADHVEEASILFADVVDFTPLSAKLTAAELVELLNEVFSYFDTLVERYGLEKIKTIGDCYMVAAGVPQPRADHARVLTLMAIELRDYVRQATFCGRQLSFRIGLNTGPVVAGVIGHKKFIYDLWGDTVNTASRMESHGAAGLIQVTAATYEQIKDEFLCGLRGNIEVKGKGQMPVWQVIGPRALAPDAPVAASN